MKCTFLWITPVKEPCPLKVLKRRSSTWWGSNPPTLSRRRRQSWRESSRRMLTFGGRLMKWTNGTSDRPAPTKASSWWWANACPLLRLFYSFIMFPVVPFLYYDICICCVKPLIQEIQDADRRPWSIRQIKKKSPLKTAPDQQEEGRNQSFNANVRMIGCYQLVTFCS